MESNSLPYFKLWLALFPILNTFDIVQTWVFFDFEANPLFALFPNGIFILKIGWTLFVPFALYVSYKRSPRVVYWAALALVFVYSAIVVSNLCNIMWILGH
jgi:hypothetical protein